MLFGSRNLTLGLLCTVLLTLVFAGLTHAKEISFLAIGYNASLRKYVQDEVIPAFKAEHGVDVALLQADWNTRMERMMVLIAGGTPPDVVVTAYYTPYEEGAMGLLEPLDRYLAQWKYTSRFPAALWDALSWRGEVLVVPQNLDFRGIGYNKRLFAESGLDPESPPQSWDALTQAAWRLTRFEGDTVAVRGYAAVTGAGGAQHLGWFMRQAGLPEMDTENFTSNLGDPKTRSALEVLAELYEAGANDRSVLSGGIERGRIAMQWRQPQHIATMLAGDPDFVTNDFGLFAPRQYENSTPAAHLFANGLGIPRASQNKDLAWKFITLMMSDEVILETQRINGFFCGRTDLLQRMTGTLPRVELWYNMFPYIQPAMLPPPRNISQTELSTLMERVYKKQLSPAAALEQAHTLWTRLLNEWKADVEKAR